MNQPIFKPIFGTDNYSLYLDYVLTIIGYVIRVPAGFIFDGASIPRMAWSLLGYTPFHPCVILAALVHDWLYLTHQTTREEADMIFKMILLRCGTRPDAAQSMYLAVRTAGILFWDHNCEDREKINRLHEIIDPRWKDFYKLPEKILATG